MGVAVQKEWKSVGGGRGKGEGDGGGGEIYRKGDADHDGVGKA